MVFLLTLKRSGTMYLSLHFPARSATWGTCPVIVCFCHMI